MLSYSQPSTFFKVRSRKSLEIIGLIGLSEYEQIIAGGMQEIFIGKKWLYITLGLGAYIKTKRTNRIASAFTFGQKFAIGTSIKKINIEICYRHFSNGSIEKPNRGHDFIGANLYYSF